jgi:hypothetical protein
MANKAIYHPGAVVEMEEGDRIAMTVDDEGPEAKLIKIYYDGLEATLVVETVEKKVTSLSNHIVYESVFYLHSSEANQLFRCSQMNKAIKKNTKVYSGVGAGHFAFPTVRTLSMRWETRSCSFYPQFIDAVS